MSVKLKPYPAYKDSGLPWLGRIPAHWDLRRLKFLLGEVDSRSVDGKEQLLRVSQYSGITQRKSQDGSDEPDTRAKSLVGYKRVAPDDLVINIMLAWNGSLGVSRYEGIASPAYCVYRFRSGALPQFYDQMLRLPIYKGRIKVASRGVVESRLRLYSDDLGCIESLLPPGDEQHAIAQFIEASDRRTNALIRVKRRLIEVLNEQKQAIIQRAVTRGLDPAAPLKPSGIPWLGDIPVHWQIVPLKYLASRVQNGATPPSDRRDYFDGGDIPWHGPSSVGASLEVGSAARYVTAKAIEDGKARAIKAPALLVVVIGATAGRMGLLLRDGSSNQQITAFDLRSERLDPELAVNQLKQAESWLRATASTATIPILDSGLVARLPLAVPPRDEQMQMRDALRVSVAPFATAVARAEREIDLIREYRTRLVSDVVTGKLDVRGVTLPETLATNPEAADEIEIEVGEADEAEVAEV